MSIVSSGITRALRALATLALLVPLLFAAQTTTGAGRAEASCPGYNNPQTGYLIVSMFIWASETPASNTCNNDSYYQGTFQSSDEHWAASIYFWDPTPGYTHYVRFSGGYSMDQYTFERYLCCGYTRIILCLSNVAYGGGVYCGWGNKVTYHPTDYVLSYENSGENPYY